MGPNTLPGPGPTTAVLPTSGTTAAEGQLGPLAVLGSPVGSSRTGLPTASPTGAASAESTASERAGSGADARNSSASIQGDGPQRFQLTPLDLAWIAGTLLALVVLAASPRIYDRWRSR